jgi:hypothetical protein
LSPARNIVRSLGVVAVAVGLGLAVAVAVEEGLVEVVGSLAVEVGESVGVGALAAPEGESWSVVNGALEVPAAAGPPTGPQPPRATTATTTTAPPRAGRANRAVRVTMGFLPARVGLKCHTRPGAPAPRRAASARRVAALGPRS